MAMSAPGRVQRPSYFYGAHSIADADELQADCLYVIGGLYGNLPALETILELADREPISPCLVFNGDFNWFNVDDTSFVRINEAVLAHHAILGNVEAELVAAECSAGCGCAYPAQVDDDAVQRSNWIHSRLKRTAASHPVLLERLRTLAMVARCRIGSCRVGIVHGDSSSLAGWRFGLEDLADKSNDAWLCGQFAAADVDVFASSHTCLPVMRCLARNTVRDSGTENGTLCVINNGAAGLPNFAHPLCGLITRIGCLPSPNPVLYGTTLRGVHIDALPVFYSQQQWEKDFLASWPEGSPAWVSYFSRLTKGTSLRVSEAQL